MVCERWCVCGGVYRHGAGAQEENLFRRSNYYQSLEDPKKIDAGRRWGYPLRDFSGVYSPSVRVFRAAESKGYEFLPEPVALDFIAVAAYSHPQLVTAKINGSHSPHTHRRTRTPAHARM